MIGDPEDLKALLALPDGGVTDEELLRFLNAANAAVKSYLGVGVELATYTEFPAVDGRSGVVLLRQHPVVAVTGTDGDDTELGVWWQRDAYWGTAAGAFGAGTKLTSGADYALHPDGSGRLYLIPGSWSGWGCWSGRGAWSGWSGWPAGHGVGTTLGALKVVYSAGYAPDDIPADLEAEVVAEAAARWSASVSVASGGSGVGGGSGSGQSVQLGQFKISQTSSSSSSSSSKAAAAGKAKLYGANRDVLDLYRVPVLA